MNNQKYTVWHKMVGSGCHQLCCYLVVCMWC